MSKNYEVKLVCLESRYYYVEAEDEEGAKKEAIRLLDEGEPDQNPGIGYLKVKETEVEEIDA